MAGYSCAIVMCRWAMRAGCRRTRLSAKLRGKWGWFWKWRLLYPTVWQHGFSHHGAARIALGKATAAAGLSWSIQNQVLRVVKQHGATPRRAVVLAADSGLVGFPERFAQAASGKAAKGNAAGAVEKKLYGWKVKSLLLPQVNPSDVLKLESKQVNGFFRVEKVRHSGEFDGGDWISEFEVFDWNEPLPEQKQVKRKK